MTTPCRLKAYVVQTYDCRLAVWAYSHNAARRDACGVLDVSWEDIESVRRAPHLDGGPYTRKELSQSYGWSFGCAECETPVYGDGLWICGVPYCNEECVRNEARRDAERHRRMALPQTNIFGFTREEQAEQECLGIHRSTPPSVWRFVTRRRGTIAPCPATRSEP